MPTNQKVNYEGMLEVLLEFKMKQEKHVKRLWIYALINLIAFLLAWIIVFYVFKLVSDHELIIPFLVFLSGVIIGSIIYKGYKNRQLEYFSITFIILGIIVILLATISWIPYTTSATFIRDDEDWTPYFYSSSLQETPVYANGSLRIISLSPFSKKEYHWYTYSLRANISIIQINISTSGPLIFTMLQSSWGGDYIVFNETMHYGWFEENPSFWVTLFWTPPTEMTYNVHFVFENPSDREVHFCFKVIEHFLKPTEEREIVMYRTLLDQNYKYVGLSLIGTVVILDGFSLKQGKRRIKETSPLS